eukprot:CAMPEP_0118677732 /NCGR_PEP_ID=MMETSP0800-20121206/2798_1 /TAXON_ID=210618 ORGANISM="Striatella unipunctata, Strain CCMP2910" /NCGR_SAMPLE_ID=MMETSP0800 /ASSEMBLY_ACC=CAM_ASM_000638 /LENGTH=316 /DNA_ID=CAMNT_0006573453 /DNA_START=312 /DNA_END=1262 /DNA_ORIENTATION=-
MSILIDSWSKFYREDACKRAMQALQFMEKRDMTPNLITYNTVLNVLAKSKDPLAPMKAEKMIQRMDKNGCEPDVYSMQSLILAWARSRIAGAPQKVEQILQSMEEKRNIKPNTHCYTAAIYSWGTSTEQYRAIRGYRLLQYMNQIEDDGLEPNIVTYTTALNACSNPLPGEEDESYHIACLIMEEIYFKENLKPIFLTYAAFFSACRHDLLSADLMKEKDEMMQHVFNRCIEDGQVGQLVLEKFKTAATNKLYHSMVGKYTRFNKLEIPQEWNQNVKGEKKEIKSNEKMKQHQRPLDLEHPDVVAALKLMKNKSQS